MKKKIRRVAMAVFAAVFLISGGMLARDLIRSNLEQKTNEDLARQVHEARQTTRRPVRPGVSSGAQSSASSSGEDPEPVPLYAESGLLMAYDALWQQNNDLASWLWIEDTKIDYPVMYTPKNPEHYIRRDFYDKRAYSGSLFIGKDSGPDDALVMIFGHNMRDGSMFSELEKYQSADYAKEHPIIHLDTMTEERDYEVITAIRSRVYEAENKRAFRYYQYSDLSDPENFETYMKGVMSAALYSTGVEAEFGDRILVLSTCSYHTENGRLAVVARQIPQETEAEEESDPG